MDDFTVTNNNPGYTGKIQGPISTERQRFLGTSEVQGKEIQISRTEEGARGQASQDVDSRRGDPINSRRPD